MLSVLDNRWQRTKFKICISIKCCLIMTESWNSLKKPHRTVQRSVPKYVWKRTPRYCIDYSEEENNDVCKSEIYQKKNVHIYWRGLTGRWNIGHHQYELIPPTQQTDSKRDRQSVLEKRTNTNDELYEWQFRVQKISAMISRNRERYIGSKSST